MTVDTSFHFLLTTTIHTSHFRTLTTTTTTTTQRPIITLTTYTTAATTKYYHTLNHTHHENSSTRPANKGTIICINLTQPKVISASLSSWQRQSNQLQYEAHHTLGISWLFPGVVIDHVGSLSQLHHRLGSKISSINLIWFLTGFREAAPSKEIDSISSWGLNHPFLQVWNY